MWAFVIEDRDVVILKAVITTTWVLADAQVSSAIGQKSVSLIVEKMYV